jgi:hypothetical protein
MEAVGHALQLTLFKTDPYNEGIFSGLALP